MPRIISGALPSAPDGRLTDVRAGHGPRVFLAMHSARCVACRDYLRSLAANSDLAEWGGRLTIVLRDSMDDATDLYDLLGGHAAVLTDPGRSIPLTDGALAVTDEWGEVFFETSADDRHELPPPAEVVNWVRFIAIQCPECVNAEGDWRFV